MTISVGDKLPEATLMIMGAEGPQPVSTSELMGSGTVAVFAVPGAFTPTCSAKHLPGFKANAEALAAKGVDKIVCVSVNDVFVMDAWGKDQGVGDKVVMAADGNGEFTRALGLELDASGFAMGTRSQRYSMLLRDGEVAMLNVEKPGAFEVSSAEYMLERL